MTARLEDLRIDRQEEPERRTGRAWLWALLALSVSGAGAFAIFELKAPHDPAGDQIAEPSSSQPEGPQSALSATGYIVAAHKIEVASKVVGRVAWIGVEKGDTVGLGQPLVRLEDDEYRAQMVQAEGNLENLQARLDELERGPRREEVARARADLEAARAELDNAAANLRRVRSMAEDGLVSRQQLENAEARLASQRARAASLENTSELIRLGPRPEEIAAARALVKEARGAMDYARTQLTNTVIRAPIPGTILERNVELGEFVTTGFVGERGAKGYVVSLADLRDLQVEVDINQNDFARLTAEQPARITTDAYPDRVYYGSICEIAPEANREKATVQVKVRIRDPDGHLRPDMNAAVAFYPDWKSMSRTGSTDGPGER